MKKKNRARNSDDIDGFQVYLRLLTYLKPHKYYFMVSIVGFALFAASTPLLAKLIESIIHSIEQKDSTASILMPAFALGIFFLRGIGSFIGTYFNTYVSNRIITDIRIEIFNHLTTLPNNYFDANMTGKIIQRLNGGVNLLSKAITDTLKVLIGEGLTIIFLFAYVFYLNWKLSLIFVAIAPFTLLLANYTTKKFRSLIKKDENILGGLIQIAKELVSGHTIMRIFDGYDYERTRYKKSAEDSFRRKMKVAKIQALATPVMQLLGAIALAVIIYLLLQPETLAAYSASSLIGYLTAVGLIPKSMRQLSGVNVDIQRGITGASLIFNLLDTKSETDEGTIDAGRVAGKINVLNLSFKYPSSSTPTLSDISFDINAGETIALVGKSGGGKSTITSLLQRFYDIDGGSISIDGIDIKDYTLKSLRKNIAFVSQNIIIFNDTIRNNIAYGALSNSTDEEIYHAAKKAHALEFIENLPQGFDTMAGDNGLHLSGGQRQRIALARAFLKDAPILILDEATAALDNESDQVIQSALKQLSKDRTTIIVAHRLSTIENADRIFVMNKGRIVENGSHHELLQIENGFYRRLYFSSEGSLINENT
jgi:subfamily B ATP-binding cassette protein MsbA